MNGLQRKSDKYKLLGFRKSLKKNLRQKQKLSAKVKFKCKKWFQVVICKILKKNLWKNQTLSTKDNLNGRGSVVNRTLDGSTYPG